MMAYYQKLNLWGKKVNQHVSSDGCIRCTPYDVCHSIVRRLSVHRGNSCAWDLVVHTSCTIQRHLRYFSLP